MSEECIEGRLPNLSVINKAAFKKKALALVLTMRPAWPVSRVSSTLIDEANAMLHNWLVARIHQQPSKGKSLR